MPVFWIPFAFDVMYANFTLSQLLSLVRNAIGNLISIYNYLNFYQMPLFLFAFAFDVIFEICRCYLILFVIVINCEKCIWLPNFFLSQLSFTLMQFSYFHL